MAQGGGGGMMGGGGMQGGMQGGMMGGMPQMNPTPVDHGAMSAPVLSLLPGNGAGPPPGQTSKPGGERRVDCQVDMYPGYNFVGRILGPRGSTLKGLEAQHNVRIFIRGRGSEKPEEEARKRGKPGYEHLEETLHVIIDGGANGDSDGAATALHALVTPVPEGADDPVKQQQLSALSQLRNAEGGGGGPMRGGSMGGNTGYGGVPMAQPVQNTALPSYMTGGNPY